MLLLSLILTAAPNAWLREEALTNLDCVRAWQQLCSVDIAHFPEFTVNDNTVAVRPYMDDDALVFKVVKSRNGVKTLVGEFEGVEVTATLTTRGTTLLWNGPDVLGSGVHAVSWTLVRAKTVYLKKSQLTKKLVPGGECKELAVYRPTEPLPACLNTK